MDPRERTGVDQQLVVHLFAPAGGAQAEVAYATVRELWLGCRQIFLMREPIAGIGLPQQLPDTHSALISDARYTADEEAALAAQERSDAECQAILRRHHDLLNLSVVLATPETAPPPAAGHSWWQDLDSQWSFLRERAPAGCLGEARIYFARSSLPPGEHLDDLLPAAARITYWGRDRAATRGPLMLWEAPPWADDRSVRRLVLAFSDEEEAHPLASEWAWSRGDTAIPPLARYLLHAAKLRARYREWRHESRTRAGTTAGAAAASPAETHQWAADLRVLRRATETAEHNMGLVASSNGLLAPEGPLADDQNLARWFQTQLDDDLAYLAIAADRAAVPPRVRTAGHLASHHPAAVDDIAKSVFVVHGRDGEAAEALFSFLEALGLRPLDWETLVENCSTASPYLRDVIMQGIAMAQAAVVLMTPDDTVWLHRDLLEPDDDVHETVPSMQARPNVILELGMALATYADRTVVLVAGMHRPMADLGGLNYIRLTDTDRCLDKIRLRLKTAGCQVSADSTDWRARAWFRDLAAYDRKLPCLPSCRRPALPKQNARSSAV